MSIKSLTIAAVALSVGYTVDYNPRPSQPGGKSISPISFKISEANAQTASQNAARRTARRTSRRVKRRHNITECSPYNGYYNCNGTYYQAITEDGKTVYVVVKP